MTSQINQPSVLPDPSSHLHFNLKSCPTCGQEIPSDRLEEIGGRIAASQHEHELTITAQLGRQFETEKARVEAKAKADLEFERQQSAAREARARDEAQTAAESAQKVAEQLRANLEAEMNQLREKTADAVETVRAEAKQREIEISAEANRTLEALVNVRIAAFEAAQHESRATLKAQLDEAEASRIAAEQKERALASQLELLQRSNEVELKKVKEDAAAEVLSTRQTVVEEGETRLRLALAAQENAVAEASARAREAEAKLSALTDQHAAAMETSLKEQREILDKAREDAINTEKARAFEENQKLSTKVADLQRAIENKTAEELGEGAEIDLLEELKKAFPEDDIRRIPKGSPGADILHVVMQRGKKCGTIIYDSKNHNQFRNEHVSKLRADQLAAGAEHAVLSTRKFPQGTRQLHLQDGVLLANPARVVLIATYIRQHLLQLHGLRVSGIERDSKTAALYDFIVSELCSSLLARIDERSNDLLTQQTKEITWHENNWKRQGEAIRAIQKAKADLENQVDLIIGTSSSNAAA